MNEFFTWEFLATMAGAIVATGLITQFIKGMLKNIPTQAVSYIVALLILLVSNYFIGALSMPTAVLSVFNAIIVSTSSNGAYSAIERIKNKP